MGHGLGGVGRGLGGGRGGVGGRMGFGEWFLRLWNRVQGWNGGAEDELALEKTIGDASRPAKICFWQRDS